MIYTARNPKDPPGIDKMPCGQFFELDDVVTQESRRGGSQYPMFKRRMVLVLEVFLVGATEASASKELGKFVQDVKKSIYSDGNTLGKRCEIRETSAGRVLRPPVGGAVIGVGLTFEIAYVEDVGKLF